MAKGDMKTTETQTSAAEFIAGLGDARRCEEAGAVDALYRRATALEPKMWGPSIIGYGSYRYKYESGREGTMCRVGFSPRKAALTFCHMGSLLGDQLFDRLGKFTAGKGCLYIKRLDQVDVAVLEHLIALSWQHMNAKFPD